MNKNMRTSAAVAILLCGVLPLASGANFGTDFEDRARVLGVTQQTEKFNQPQQDCRTDYVKESGSRNVGGSIIGGVAGALLGSQVGGGNGRTAATAVGAITGAIVGDRVDNNGAGTVERPTQQCRTVDNWQTRVSGYEVKYEYKGRVYSAMMPYSPGEYVRVRVNVTPIGY